MLWKVMIPRFTQVRAPRARPRILPVHGRYLPAMSGRAL